MGSAAQPHLAAKNGPISAQLEWQDARSGGLAPPLPLPSYAESRGATAEQANGNSRFRVVPYSAAQAAR